MNIKISIDCGSCLNKDVCKYKDNCEILTNRESLELDQHKSIFIKNNSQIGKAFESENLNIVVTCKHHRSQLQTLTYPEGVRNIPGHNWTLPYTSAGEQQIHEVYYTTNNGADPTISKNGSEKSIDNVDCRGDGIGYVYGAKSFANNAYNNHTDNNASSQSAADFLNKLNANLKEQL